MRGESECQTNSDCPDKEYLSHTGPSFLLKWWCDGSNREFSNPRRRWSGVTVVEGRPLGLNRRGSAPFLLRPKNEPVGV